MNNEHVENIIHVYLSASERQVAEGMSWYDKAHELAAELSPGDVLRGAGVIAALSPRMPWPRNEKLARQAFASGTVTGSTGMFNALAQRILNGEDPFTVLNGDKTRAFCAAIASPATSTIPTIDAHAHDIAVGRICSPSERSLGKRAYRELADAYVRAAELGGIGIAQMQAVVWVAWREMHNMSNVK